MTPAIFVIVVILGCIMACLFRRRGAIREWYMERRDRIYRFRDQGTMMIITYQIIVNLQSNHAFAGVRSQLGKRRVLDRVEFKLTALWAPVSV